MASNAEIQSGFDKVVDLIKGLKSGQFAAKAMSGQVDRVNLASGENVFLSVPDATWTANEVIEIDWGCNVVLPAYVSGSTTAPTITFRIKKGAMILMQSASMLQSWNANRGYTGRTCVHTRDLAQFGVASRYEVTNAIGGFTNAGNSYQSGVLAQNAVVKDASPITFVVFISTPAANLQVVLHQLVVKRYSAQSVI